MKFFLTHFTLFVHDIENAFHASKTKLTVHCTQSFASNMTWGSREVRVEIIEMKFQFDDRNYKKSFYRAIKPGKFIATV